MAKSRMFKISLDIPDVLRDHDLELVADASAGATPIFKVDPFIDPENGNKMLSMVDETDCNHQPEFELNNLNDLSKDDMKLEEADSAFDASSMLNLNNPSRDSEQTKEQMQRDCRQRALERYKEKGYVRERTFLNTHKYACRKNFANIRLRIKGRFVSKEEEAKLKLTNNNHPKL